MYIRLRFLKKKCCKDELEDSHMWKVDVFLVVGWKNLAWSSHE